MAESMRTLKRRIGFLHNIKKITKAMQMVAVSKLRLTQTRAEHAKAYTLKLEQSVARLIDTSSNHPMLEERPVQQTGYLVITSDRGLCGGYNANLLRFMVQQLAERHASSDEYQLFVIGQKGSSYLARRKYEMMPLDVILADVPFFTSTESVAEAMAASYMDQQIDKVYLCYNKFVNIVSQQPVIEQALPFVSPELNDEQKEAQYEDEPSSKELLMQLLPCYFAGIIYNAVLSAKTSEFASKMTAMSNATDTTIEMIDKLIVRYNRTRQATITQDIAEIVNGVTGR